MTMCSRPPAMSGFYCVCHGDERESRRAAPEKAGSSRAGHWGLIGVLLLLLGCASAFASTPVASKTTRWISLPNPQIEVDGLPWYRENGNQLVRLPERLKATYPRAVWELAQDPTGGRLRFRTNSREIAIRLEYPKPPHMKNMQSFGQSGVDLYVGNTYWGTAIAGWNAKPGKTYEHVYFNFPTGPRVERNVTLYLPTYIGVKVLAIGVDGGAELSRPPAFALTKPVVFYGTSITQGCCASRPGMDYQAIVGRRLNLDFVNLGFSGAAFYEPALARAVAAIDASCYVLDGWNFHNARDLNGVLLPFIKVIRSAHPSTPILVASMIYSSNELSSNDEKASYAYGREYMRDVVAELRAHGDHEIQIVNGTDLISPLEGDGLTDGTHPNDLGFAWMADVWTKRLASVLGLHSSSEWPIE